MDTISLKHALLGFLNYGPKTGYELKQSVDRSIRPVWSASLSQIYPTLSQMERDGLLAMEVCYQNDRPNRKIYHITEAGRAELRRWLREPVDLPAMHQPFFIKVLFGANLTNEEILAQFRHQLELHRKLLATYQGPLTEVTMQSIEESGLMRDGVFWVLSVEAGVELEKTRIKWLEECIRRVEALPDTLEEYGKKKYLPDNPSKDQIK